MPGKANTTVEIWVGDEPVGPDNPIPFEQNDPTTPFKVDDDATQAALADILTQATAIVTQATAIVAALPAKTAGTGTKSNVASNAGSVTLLASNSSRKRWSVYNDSTAVLYIDLTGGTASATSFSVALQPGAYFEGPLPVNTGAITGIWASANGNARLTEFA